MNQRAPLNAVRRTCLHAVVFLLVAPLGVAGNAFAIELGDLFRTPEQRAAARLEGGDYDALIEDAPDARWEGLGRYRKGDHAGAAEAFARARESLEENADALSAVDRNEALYDQATAATRAGRPGDALPLFDEIIASDPQHVDAQHNREIARQLQALDAAQGQQPNNSQGDGKGDPQGEQPDDPSAEAGDAASASNPGEERDAASAEQSGQPGEQESDASGGDESSARAGDATDTERAGDRSGDDETADPTGSDEDEQQAAREALAAEAASAADRDGGGDDAGAALAGTGIDEVPTPSEGQQATEQWLRRIADDPTGLLRRRLEQSHRNDYPEVRDSDEPW